jgi:hypothetical protein
MSNHRRKQQREGIITKLQERNQEIEIEIEKLKQDLIFNQKIIKELEEESDYEIRRWREKKAMKELRSFFI